MDVPCFFKLSCLVPLQFALKWLHLMEIWFYVQGITPPPHLAACERNGMAVSGMFFAPRP